MTVFRPLAALALMIGVFLATPGCGGSKPATTGDNKDNKDVVKPGGGTPTDPGAGTNPAQPAKVDVTTGVGKEAVDFLQAVRGGTARADQLSTAFQKAIGLPVVFEADKGKGFSVSSAEDWLKRVGASTGFGPPLTATQDGETALVRGSLVGKSGGYALRMVKEGGAWKVDWLSASTVEVKKPLATGAGDAVLQEFAVAAVVEAICDQDAMPAPQRHAVIAAGLTPTLRAAWAAPLDGDKTAGYDYSPSKLGFKIADIGGKAESVSYSHPAEGTYFAEIARAGGAKTAYLVKVAKGQVESIAPQ